MHRRLHSDELNEWPREKLTWPHYAASQFVEAAGLRWHVQRLGEGAPLLLVHGTGASTHSWRRVMPLLANRYSVIAVDLPGHAFTDPLPSHRTSIRSMSAALAALLQQLRVTPAYCVGHSAGAVVLCQMVLDEHIAPRALVSTNGAFLPLGGITARLFSPVARVLATSPTVAAMVSRHAGGTRESIAKLIDRTGSKLDEEDIELYARLARKPLHVAGALRMMANWDLHAFLRELPRLAVPMTLIVGGNDLMVPPGQASIVQRRVLAATVRTLNGLGHLAHEERPGLFAQEVAASVHSVKKPHAVVIGSGFGGLAAAVRLGARGYRVTVLEQLDAPGGRAYVFRDAGFTFDAGPTIITAPFLLRDLWTLCGRRFEDDVDLRPLSPFYRILFHDGIALDVSADEEAMRVQIERVAPGEFAGYRGFLDASEAIYRVAFEELAHRPFDSPLGMFALLPDLARLRSYRSVHGLAASFVKHPKLRFALSFHPLFVGGNPFTTTSIYALIAYLERRWGVHFAIGGTGSIVEGLVKLIEGQGNAVRYGARVTAITQHTGRATGVRLDTGEEIAAEVVVSNADSVITYNELLAAAPRRRRIAKLRRAELSMSLFVWYFGTSRRYPEVPHHTILVGPRYRELLDDIFKHKILAEDFSLYLHRPTATDDSLAPVGCDAFYVLSPVPHLGGDVDWLEKAESYRRAIALKLEATVLPGLESHVVTSRIMTPLDFRDRLLSHQGAAFGLAPSLLQSAWFRPHNRSTELENLYLVGAGTHPGAGVPGVLSSARILDTVVPDASVFQ